MSQQKHRSHHLAVLPSSPWVSVSPLNTVGHCTALTCYRSLSAFFTSASKSQLPLPEMGADPGELCYLVLRVARFHRQEEGVAMVVTGL